MEKTYSQGLEEEILEKASRQSKILQINKRAVIVAVVVVLILVIASYVLTFVLPRGSFERTDEGAIIPGSYREDPALEGIKWWQFILSPVMILNPSDAGAFTIYGIILLMLIIGAVFTVLEESGILVYFVRSITFKYHRKKYFLLCALAFTFMFLASTVGMFEEFIPLVPIIVVLSYAMGWDALVGLGISVLAGCFGFAAGVLNYFNVGIPQQIGNLPLFSGVEVRIISFVLAYVILIAFLLPYAKKIDKYPQKSPLYLPDLERKKELSLDVTDFTPDKIKSRALRWFGIWLGLVIVCAITSIFVHALSEYILYITLFAYVVGGFGASWICGVRGKKMLRLVGKGMMTLVPAVAMILIAGGVRYIITEGDIMDTILYKILPLLENQNPIVSILIVYVMVFIFEIFIPSGSAKAVLLMPIIFQLSGVVGIHPQVAVMTFAFGDGLSNVLLPTNAGLLLILGLTTADYGTWFKWSAKIQFSLLAASILVLIFAQMVVYA